MQIMLRLMPGYSNLSLLRAPEKRFFPIIVWPAEFARALMEP